MSGAVRLLGSRVGLAVLALTGVAAALRFATIGEQSYWYDEAITASMLDGSLADVFRGVVDTESTPPLYYVVAWLWAQVVGSDETQLRSLSALAGTLVVPVAFAAGRIVASARIGLAAAVLASVSPMLVWYSQEARAYSLLALLGGLSFVFFALARVDPSRRRLAWWAVVSALAIATHYFAAFLIVPEALWLFQRWRGRALVPIGAVGAVSLAVLPMAIEQAENDGARFIRGSSEIGRLASVPKQFLVGYDAPGETPAIVLAALATLYGVYLLIRRATRDEQRGAIPLAVLAGVVVAVPALLSATGADYLITRNVIVALVPALVVLAAGFGSVRAGRGGPAAAALLAGIGVAMCVGVALDERHQRDDWRGVAERLGRPNGTRMLVVSPVNGRIPLEVYLPRSRKARPQERAAFTELDVVRFAPRGPGDPANAPRPPNPPTLPGLQGPERIETETYTLLRYRAPTPLAFPDEPLYGSALGGAEAELVVQPPR